MKVNSFFSVAALVATTSFSSFVLAQSNLTLEQRIEQLEQQNQTRSQLQSQMSMQIIELQKEVKELRGIIEEHDYKLQQIQDRQRDLYRDIENRLSALPKGGAVSSTPSSSTTTTPSDPPVINPGTTKAVKETVSGDGRVEFENAFKLVRNRNYDQAVQSFESFLQNYPTSGYADNARFWIGQVYFAQSKFSEAEQQFSLLRTEYPESSKMSAAILKLAEIKVRLENWEEAKALYSEVVNKYTGAPQQLARKGLQDIKAKGH
ncbi:MAG: tol-pal system protein YbgF [Kangiellaceae bacterium]|nr:tol-pal system protein YbgF [Kangiellaceae bacterium]MCW8999879.1 tol-pal system protein YbgF [Kangiellaceae bacterium]MCW9017337.1 tol-pal system protein YbgF [Kangiellaceae bacterium]